MKGKTLSSEHIKSAVKLINESETVWPIKFRVTFRQYVMHKLRIWVISIKRFIRSFR
ncbi:hypothetical protein LCGC14_2711380 [marine sediment metagenome]|uniref:Uncharacterized protein n=1 Tax=marine sediment metagenome TaxID=412755 RepID=A0A0F9C4J3_9ZZZZ